MDPNRVNVGQSEDSLIELYVGYDTSRQRHMGDSRAVNPMGDEASANLLQNELNTCGNVFRTGAWRQCTLQLPDGRRVKRPRPVPNRPIVELNQTKQERGIFRLAISSQASHFAFMLMRLNPNK